MPSKKFIKPFKKDSVEYRNFLMCHQCDFVARTSLDLNWAAGNKDFYKKGMKITKFKHKLFIAKNSPPFYVIAPFVTIKKTIKTVA